MGPEGPKPVVLTLDRQVKRLSVVDFPVAVDVLGKVRVPRTFNPRSPQSRRDLASTLRNLDVDEHAARRRQRSVAEEDDKLAALRAELRAHPCHACPDREEHARWAERYERLRRDTDGLHRRIAGRTNTVARTFDRVCGVLDELGYLAGDTVTEPGRQLAEIYSESDLLVVECLRTGLWDRLDTAGLAACVSALVFEARQFEEQSPKLPGGAVRTALADMVGEWARLSEVEQRHRLEFLREPDAGFAWAAWRWASGSRLDAVLSEGDLSAGDFVRWVKQAVDLLDQIVDAAPAQSPVHAAARSALGALRRGVVAYSSVG
jgi:ATP-dependent RNA helicase HelY